MQFTFLDDTGKVAFIRDDAEQAAWVQEEMNMNATFPFLPDKTIQRGMTVIFQDLGEWQAFEVRKCSLIMADSYQQITAESIAISELTDCHIGDDIEITDKTVKQALRKVLPGTGWEIGNDTTENISSCDIQRGSVWQAVNTIRTNWNAYIFPRVTIDSTGITGRFLDIVPAGGVWRGLRLSIDKNISDTHVTYDDSELHTALYGYGGSVRPEGAEENVEITFADVEWKKTADHPAKPKGQKYLEFPEMTALYGRNGKPRFGYYQNMDIEDPKVLLRKTWETLKSCSKPKVSITGTVTDLKRYGYNDIPLRLHDLCVVEIRPAGILLQLEIIQLTIDLVDPTGNTPTIGDYVPNIIYIGRDTYEQATGESGGASGSSGGRGSPKAKQEGEFRTSIRANTRDVVLYARKVDEQENILSQAGMEIDPITGVLIYADDNENMIGSKIQAQSDMITLEVKERKEQGDNLSSKIQMQQNAISLVVRETGPGDYEVNSASIVMGINKQADQHQSYIKLRADTIDLRGYVTVSQLKATDAKIDNLMSGKTLAGDIKANLLSASTSFSLDGKRHSNSTITIDGVNYNIVTWRNA